MKKNVDMKKKITIFSAHPSLISSFHIGFFFFFYSLTLLRYLSKFKIILYLILGMGEAPQFIHYLKQAISATLL